MSTAPRKHAFRLGLIINPLAGLGGTVALKGSDGAAAQEALRRGARPLAPARAARALSRLAADGVDLLVAGGGMGEAAVTALGWTARVVTPAASRTTAEHTVYAAAEMRRYGIDLLLFAGGDGTARDILSVVGSVPMLGIPTGVKMHSAVFATSPENAGLLANAMRQGRACLRDADVVDLDETALRRGIVSTRLFGVARVPYERRLLQQAKCAAFPSEMGLEAACVELAAELPPGLILFGPGTTTQRVLAQLGLQGTLLGVDAVCNGAMLARDLTELQILRVMDGRPAHLVVGIVGGQGFLFGRGNQQLSAAVIRRIGMDHITVIAGAEKLAMLGSGGLFVDTGDPALDAKLSGYVRVRTAPGRAMLCKLVA